MLLLLIVFGVSLAPDGAAAQPTAGGEPEVRQIVTFLFQPGRGPEAHDVYRRRLKPIYEQLPDLLRFRAYRETESPEPLDLVVVSSYRGMAGMDRANEGLRRPGPEGVTALSLYGALSAMTAHHHDQFVEMIAALGDPPPTQRGGGLVVFEYLRLVPGGEGPLLESVRAERTAAAAARPGVAWSETGRMLVSDGWDVLRIYGVASLGDWHRYLSARRTASWFHDGGRWVAAKKTIMVRDLPDLGVR